MASVRPHGRRLRGGARAFERAHHLPARCCAGSSSRPGLRLERAAEALAGRLVVAERNLRDGGQHLQTRAQSALLSRRTGGVQLTARRSRAPQCLLEVRRPEARLSPLAASPSPGRAQAGLLGPRGRPALPPPLEAVGAPCGSAPRARPGVHRERRGQRVLTPTHLRPVDAHGPRAGEPAPGERVLRVEAQNAAPEAVALDARGGLRELRALHQLGHA